MTIWNLLQITKYKKKFRILLYVCLQYRIRVNPSCHLKQDVSYVYNDSDSNSDNKSINEESPPPSHQASKSPSETCCEINGTICAAVLPKDIRADVTFDAIWLTRGHSSQTDIGCVIDLLTGFVRDFEIMSKLCIECEHGKLYLGETSAEFHV
ncbi:hypothetical protein TNCT_331781 [Trichonephila clavata]|uniref:Uncharacterized protein n=1 Tax=Trichonephila clavata TaxID=2740835 RepID=A0A8X6FXF5_TRICU|nr:hypothetical protein TNCT_331781 [Trichonephila clavata]